MSAFYSQTDEADDKNKTYYTGVIGKLNLPTPEYKLRFNYNELKRECGLEEIFDLVEEEVEIPKEWLERVKISAPVTYQKTTSKFSQKVPSNDKYKGLDFGYGGKSNAHTDTYDALYGHHEKPAASAGTKHGSTELSADEESFYQTYMDQFKGIDQDDPGDLVMDEATGGIVFKPAESKHEELGAGEEVHPAHNPNTDYIDYLTVQYGEDVACAYDQAMSGLEDIEPDSCDEVLKRIIAEAYAKMTPSAQTVFSIN